MGSFTQSSVVKSYDIVVLPLSAAKLVIIKGQEVEGNVGSLALPSNSVIDPTRQTSRILPTASLPTSIF